MQINWCLVGICTLIWFAGYCFGYSVGKANGIREVLTTMTGFLEKLPKGKESFDYEHKKGD